LRLSQKVAILYRTAAFFSVDPGKLFNDCRPIENQLMVEQV